MPVDISSALGKMTRPIQNIGQMSTFSQFIGRRARPLYVKSSAIYTPPQLARTNRRKVGINVETATVEQLATSRVDCSLRPPARLAEATRRRGHGSARRRRGRRCR